MKRFLLFAACAALLTTPIEAAALVVSNGWFRALPGNLPAAGYFSLRNTGTVPALLTGAQSQACRRLTLHMSHQMGGMMHMMAVESIEIPAGGSLDLAPGGYHLMCEGATLIPGETISVTLRFKDGDSLTTNFQVMNATGH